MSRLATRLYLVTPPAFEPAAFASLLPRVLAAADVAALRLRLPGADAASVARAAAALLPVTRLADIALVLDGDAGQALRLGCDGVHVPAAGVRAARAAVGDALSVGAACGASYDAAMTAAEDGADYVAFGPVAGEAAVDPDIVASWAGAMVVPCVVGGGLTPGNAGRWAATGAEFLAVGRAVWESNGDPEASLRRVAAEMAKAAAGTG
jgi:thiamine-phosphate pyrophosphorylase